MYNMCKIINFHRKLIRVCFTVICKPDNKYPNEITCKFVT